MILMIYILGTYSLRLGGSIMAKIFTIGEALIDFISEQSGIELKEVNSFQKAPGGAPANVELLQYQC